MKQIQLDLDNNDRVIESELGMLKEGRYRLTPLAVLQSDAISIALNTSPEVLEENGLLDSLFNIRRSVNGLNSRSRIRESFFLAINMTPKTAESTRFEGLLESLKSLDEEGIQVTNSILNSFIYETIPKLRKLTIDNAEAVEPLQAKPKYRWG